MDRELEAVILLLRAALVRRRADTALGDVDWLRVMAIADAHNVLPTVAAGLERLATHSPALVACSAFLSDLAAAQAPREAHTRTELVQAVTLLNEIGITPLTLKGAAILAETRPGEAAWRFMSDIDLLVREEQAADAVMRLRSAGYALDEAIYDPREDHHYPALTAPCHVAAVEIHTRVLAQPTRLPLAPQHLFDRARVVEVQGSRMLIPCPVDRLIHLIAHGQIASHHYARRHTLLREALDFEYLLRLEFMDLDALYQTFRSAGHEDEFCAFIDLMSHVLGHPVTQSRWAGRHQRWVNEVLEALSSPVHRKRWIARDAARMTVELFTTAEGLRHLAGLAANPARLRFFLKQRTRNIVEHLVRRKDHPEL